MNGKAFIKRNEASKATRRGRRNAGYHLPEIKPLPHHATHRIAKHAWKVKGEASVTLQDAQQVKVDPKGVPTKAVPCAHGRHFHRQEQHLQKPRFISSGSMR